MGLSAKGDSAVRGRIGRVVVLAAAVAFVAAACSSTEETSSSSTVAGGEGPRGGTLVAATDADPGQFNPAITTSGSVHTGAELIYNGLVELDEAQQPVPELAESWEVLEDGARYRFHLVEGVLWHDGTPFTSADVKFTFEEALLQYHSRTKSSLSGVLDRIETPDERTVEFVFNQPYAPLLQQLNVTEAPIIPKHIYEGTDIPNNDDANLRPVGTGPFVFESYTPGSEVTFTANLNYFKEGLPLLDRVVLRIIPEDANQVASLESGDIQWAFNVPGVEARRLDGSDEIDLLRTGNNPGGANCIMTVSYNLDRPVLADVRVRRAIALGLDQQRFLDNVLFGQGAVAEAPIHSGIPFAHDPDVAMPGYDPEEAGRLLDAAGWGRDGGGTRTSRGVPGVPDGTPLSIDFLYFPTFNDYAQLAAAELAEIGVDLRIGDTALERDPFVQRVFVDRDFDTNVISYCNGTDPEIGVRRMYVSSNINTNQFSNAAAYRNPDIDRLFDEARAEVDTAARTDLYRQISDILVEDLPYYWLVETTNVRGYRTSCSGFGPAGHFAEAASCS